MKREDVYLAEISKKETSKKYRKKGGKNNRSESNALHNDNH